MLTALLSAKGSPGVTTTAVALAAAWPNPVLVAECDLAGGDVSAGLFGGALEQRSGGLLDLALAARRTISTDDVISRSVPMPIGSDALLLPGIQGPAQRAIVSESIAPITEVFRELEAIPEHYDVISDCGRVSDHLPVELLRRCDAIVAVLRPSLGAVHHLRELIVLMREALPDFPGEALGVAVVGDRPYPPIEVAEALERPLLGALPLDVGAASTLRGEGMPSRSFARAPLLRAAAALARTLRAQTRLAVAPAHAGGLR